jgi:hypothetical protein
MPPALPGYRQGGTNTASAGKTAPGRNPARSSCCTPPTIANPCHVVQRRFAPSRAWPSAAPLRVASEQGKGWALSLSSILGAYARVWSEKQAKP